MSRNIPSLDGLRAVSIGFVIASHFFGNAFKQNGLAATAALMFGGNGNLGVAIFFGISGFLITNLLVGEEKKRGAISLKGFYIRRGFRIFPAFYVYLGTLLALGALGLNQIFPKTWISAALYIRNYYPLFEDSGDLMTGHAWSLGVEEQFYLFWPPFFALLGRRRAPWLAGALILLSPVLRVANYVLWPASRTDMNYMAHTRIDALMVGCLAALLFDNARFKALIARAFAWQLPILSFPFLMFASPLLNRRFGGFYMLTVGYGLEAVAIILILLWVVERPTTLLGKLLNTQPVAHIGRISYSLYLWQQLFVFRHVWWSLPMTLIAAESSYWFVEKPFLRLRDRFLKGAPVAKASVETSA